MLTEQEATFPSYSLFADIGGSLGCFLGWNLVGVCGHIGNVCKRLQNMVRKIKDYFGQAFMKKDNIILN